MVPVFGQSLPMDKTPQCSTALVQNVTFTAARVAQCTDPSTAIRTKTRKTSGNSK
jgi:hypothetical protein